MGLFFLTAGPVEIILRQCGSELCCVQWRRECGSAKAHE